MGKRLKLVKDKFYKFFKDTWESYCDNAENYPYLMFPNFYPHNFGFYKAMMNFREEKNIENSKNS